MHPVRRDYLPGRDVGGQGLVGGGIAVVRGDPGEPEPVRCHPAGGDRRTPVFHVSSFCHGANPRQADSNAGWAGWALA